MGRARGSAAAVMTGGFDSVVGVRRGGSQPISFRRPSPAADAEVGRLLHAAAGGSYEDALWVLARHPDAAELPEDTPGRRLLHAIARQALADVATGLTEDARNQLKSLGAASPWVAPQALLWHRSRTNQVVHLWPDGHRFEDERGPLSLGITNTLCGREVTGRTWERAQRGQAGEVAAGPTTVPDGFGTVQRRACKDCFAHPDAHATGELDEHPDAPLYSRTASERLLEDLAAAAPSAVMAGAELDAPGFLDRVAEELEPVLDNHVARFGYENRARALNNLLDFDLRGDLAAVLGQSDDPDTFERLQQWSEALTLADFEELVVTLRRDPEADTDWPLYQKLADRLG